MAATVVVRSIKILISHFKNHIYISGYDAYSYLLRSKANTIKPVIISTVQPGEFNLKDTAYFAIVKDYIKKTARNLQLMHQEL